MFNSFILTSNTTLLTTIAMPRCNPLSLGAGRGLTSLEVLSLGTPVHESHVVTLPLAGRSRVSKRDPACASWLGTLSVLVVSLYLL
jgi:hypothetical protein